MYGTLKDGPDKRWTTQKLVGYATMLLAHTDNNTMHLIFSSVHD